MVHDTQSVKHVQNAEWRNLLIDALTRYRRQWPQELTTIDQMVEFVEREPGCFDRATVEGHITGSAWLVAPDSRNVLLNHHRKLDKWLHVGGHADGNGNVLDVALTEAREESGITDVVPVTAEIFDIDIHPIPARGDDPEHLHFDVRYACRALHTEIIVSEESHDLAWVGVDDIAPYTTEESMLRMARKWMHLNQDLFL